MSVYYKYATDGSKLVVSSYVDDFLYYYTYEEQENWFVDTLGKRYHMNFLVYHIGLFPLEYHNLRNIIFN